MDEIVDKQLNNITNEKIKDIRDKYKYGNGIFLAKEYGVCRAIISEVVNKRGNYANH